MGVCALVFGFLALAAATHSLRTYHWFLLLLIPGAVIASEQGRRFFLGWAPLFLFWIAYDRLRLLQPFLLDRVAVPAHAAHAWLVAHAASPVWAAASVAAQLVYLSHLFVYPLLFLTWWLRGRSRQRDRDRFSRHVRAFTVLNALGFLGYVFVPAAPPWWITLYGTAQPTPGLMAAADLGAAMHGVIIEHMIATAPQWFAAVPSLHGGYPVLLFLLNRRSFGRRGLAAVAAYGVAIWTATVVLNQHYIIDLVAGAVLAAGAYAFARER
jgi:hypothetical protein